MFERALKAITGNLPQISQNIIQTITLKVFAGEYSEEMSLTTSSTFVFSIPSNNDNTIIILSTLNSNQ